MKYPYKHKDISFSKNIISKDLYIKEMSDWYEKDLRKEHCIFSITATAGAGYSTKKVTKPLPIKYCSHFRTEVLKKIRKRLSPYNDYLKWDDCYYEQEDQTKIKGKSWAKPHHIHGIFVFPKDLERKIWIAEKKTISDRLDKDLKSTKAFKDILIEPVWCAKGWLAYITKRKDFNDNAY